MQEAKYYKKLENKNIQCLLCPHKCKIPLNKEGLCRGRKNINGILISQNYGKYVSLSMDPIEKKPLYHFHPGKMILSLCPNGCNFNCKFCQNWTISQKKVKTYSLSPEETVNLAFKYHSFGICYTYTEPLIWYDYLLDTAKLAYKKKIKNVLVTNGYINPSPLEELLPYISAMNIDLKSMKETFYKEICNGHLQPVLDTIKIASTKCHIEITNLVIPGLNDTDEDFKKITDFIFKVNPFIPLHFSSYFPCYKLNINPTPFLTLKKAKNIASKKLSFVYIGNVTDEESNSTFCPQCKEKVITRKGYNIVDNTYNGKCRKCNIVIQIS